MGLSYQLSIVFHEYPFPEPAPSAWPPRHFEEKGYPLERWSPKEFYPLVPLKLFQPGQVRLKKGS